MKIYHESVADAVADLSAEGYESFDGNEQEGLRMFKNPEGCDSSTPDAYAAWVSIWTDKSGCAVSERY